jgi:hypothetical protein
MRGGQASLAYLAEGKGGIHIVGKFGFSPMVVQKLPAEDVKWQGQIMEIILDLGVFVLTVVTTGTIHSHMTKIKMGPSTV